MRDQKSNQKAVSAHQMELIMHIIKENQVQQFLVFLNHNSIRATIIIIIIFKK